MLSVSMEVTVICARVSVQLSYEKIGWISCCYLKMWSSRWRCGYRWWKPLRNWKRMKTPVIVPDAWNVTSVLIAKRWIIFGWCWQKNKKWYTHACPVTSIYFRFGYLMSHTHTMSASVSLFQFNWAKMKNEDVAVCSWYNVYFVMKDMHYEMVASNFNLV